MGSTQLTFEFSSAYLLLFALIGGLLSWFFYINDFTSIPKPIKILLFALRGLIFFFLAGLLISPLLKYLNREKDPPVSVIIIDNSSSVSEVSDSSTLQNIFETAQLIQNSYPEDHEVHIANLDIKPIYNYNELIFDKTQTNLHETLNSLNSKFEGKNFRSVVLISDGIYNAGNSPDYKNRDFDLFTVGVGDTSLRKDISIQAVRHNELSYQGNQFPIEAEILNEGFPSTQVNLSLFHKGQKINSAQINFSQEKESVRHTFLVNAKEIGKQAFTITVSPQSDEFNKQNNSRTIFMEVIEGTENVLIIGRSPHPDIKALRSAIEQNPNYTVETYISSIQSPNPKHEQYDLLIFHNILPLESQQGPLSKIDILNTPKWLINPNPNSYSRLSETFEGFRFNIMPGQSDLITPVSNSAFSHFKLSPELNQFLQNAPPVKVPFGTISGNPDTESLLFQKVGSVETARPLLLFTEEAPRSGLFAGDGLWRWRLHNYNLNNSHLQFNELILKSVQFLSTKIDRRKLRIKTSSPQVSDEVIVLETEIYNNLFERVYNIPVLFQVEDEEGNMKEYQYSTSPASNSYKISGLSPGVYKYKASANVSGKNESTHGEFIVYKTELEQNTLRADFNLLRSLARKNNGIFVPVKEFEILTDTLKSRQYQSLIRANISFDPLINLFWALIVILAMASFEWILRKYHGGY